MLQARNTHKKASVGMNSGCTYGTVEKEPAKNNLGCPFLSHPASHFLEYNLLVKNKYCRQISHDKDLQIIKRKFTESVKGVRDRSNSSNAKHFRAFSGTNSPLGNTASSH